MEPEFEIGDEVEKFTGDYQCTGVVRGIFHFDDEPDSPVRYVVRHAAEGGGFFFHIYSGKNLHLVKKAKVS